uniref:Pre-mRNA 3'-end-processing factor FIP1 n=1 Tax=Sinocyclocheilus anshuiensis TaxID=1608454 RepID=A0A671KDW3_9TELE
MSAEEADKTTTTDASAGDEEEEWLYGGQGSEYFPYPLYTCMCVYLYINNNYTQYTHTNYVNKNFYFGCDSSVDTLQMNEEAPGEDEDSESDSDDDDDDVRVTIGDIKTGAPQYAAYGGTPVNLNIKSAGSRAYGAVGTKVKGIDLEAPGSINGVPVLEVDMESFEEKPWRKPGADLSDYFNYGFNEDTWKAYCEKQKRLRMGLDILNIGSTTSKISKEITVAAHAAKADFSSPSNLYKAGLNPARISPPHWAGPASQEMSYYTKIPGTIDVIGGQTASISRVEGRRRHNLEGNNIQVTHMTSLRLNPPRCLLLSFPRDHFPPPTGGPPPSLIPTMDNSGHPGGYDGRPVAPYPFPTGGFPPPMQGAVNPWPGLMDNPKQWDYYPRRDKEREKERERDRPRERGHERDHSPSAVVYNRLGMIDEERYRSYRDYGDRGYERHRERSSREKEERHRERRHREKEEGRHKSSRSSSRRRHDSEEGDSHRRHKHKKSKRSKEGKDPSEERSADQENQEAME